MLKWLLLESESYILWLIVIAVLDICEGLI